MKSLGENDTVQLGQRTESYSICWHDMALANAIERIPPQNVEAEQSVLGSLLIDKDAIIKVGDLLVPGDFYKDTHGMIYEACLDLFNRREPIDIISLSSCLQEKKQLEAVGGRAYLAELASSVPTSTNVVFYGQIVQKKSTLRRLIRAAAQIASLGYDENEDVNKLLDRAEQAVFGVSQQFLKQQFMPLRELLTEAFERIDELHKEGGKLRGIPSGFIDLDKKLAGLQRSNLVILAARPSVGKTSLALDIARHIAVKEKAPVGIFSLEMSKEELTDRLLCAQADVDLWKLRTGKLSDRESGGMSDFSKLGNAFGVLSESPLYIDDTAVLTINEVRTKARRMQAEHNLGMLVIDYLQLMESSGNKNVDNRVQEVAEISRGLKSIARELNIPVIALSQLSRAVEQRQKPVPKLADLRESGAIEQDADVVMFLYREELYKPETPRQHITEVHIAKHRNGPTGVVELYFDAEKATFKNLDPNMSLNAGIPPEPLRHSYAGGGSGGFEEPQF